MTVTDWNPLLRGEFEQPYWHELQRFVADERRKCTVFPSEPEVYAALHLTPYADTRVVILGQDPYHGNGQAHGLCFSVQRGVAVPPSLANIYAELQSDLGIERPAHGNLEAWARQGVLMLNTCLTVRSGQAGSHHGKGWERFTDQVLRVVDDKPTRVVFLLWGAPARKKRALILARFSMAMSVCLSKISWRSCGRAMVEMYHSSISLIPLGFFIQGAGTQAMSPRPAPGTTPSTARSEPSRAASSSARKSSSAWLIGPNSSRLSSARNSSSTMGFCLMMASK